MISHGLPCRPISFRVIAVLLNSLVLNFTSAWTIWDLPTSSDTVHRHISMACSRLGVTGEQYIYAHPTCYTPRPVNLGNDAGIPHGVYTKSTSDAPCPGPAGAANVHCCFSLYTVVQLQVELRICRNPREQMFHVVDTINVVSISSLSFLETRDHVCNSSSHFFQSYH
ncbi:hypothetical protein EDD22DRAFT_567227 [Suillus occidentalis]|nr:hypothetical protein EDD22DRAFT_567227 [Suillus occidentalis]